MPEVSIDSLAVANDMLRRGIMPLPVPVGKMGPVINGWQKLDITVNNVAFYFDGSSVNVGGRMGPKSNHLTDVDLDCSEAMKLAPCFLPDTDSIYGRKSKPRSHYLYTCPDPPDKAADQFLDENGKMIVELRLGGHAKGAQSLMPGSINKKSGEIYEWDMDGKRAEAAYSVLHPRVAMIAVGVLLIRHWPEEGGRHHAAQVAGGFLARAGWSQDAVEHFVETICTVHGGVNEPLAHAKTARDSWQAHADGKHAYGYPELITTFTEPVAKLISQWLGYQDHQKFTVTTDSESGKPIILPPRRP